MSVVSGELIWNVWIVFRIGIAKLLCGLFLLPIGGKLVYIEPEYRVLRFGENSSEYDCQR